ncbi:MAG: branched-chain amino acid ABC transporter permease [Saprospiraceae bacterium]|nr:branched-chain amino acid ABC transporter permease [Saprospiraceae bacterium]MBK7787453.1 branched-chain amino acid ABC transporter permease [Saprospiraceae bacterium]MBK8849243.1 branched-chain amino acid ABC transporter permease [Saprospiraceae bacterium]MBK9688889.1 branched-chain amino acid ABC transporter permease [Saprospiraceae bacterium]
MIQIIANILIASSLYLLLANSFSLIYYPSRIFHIANAAVISFGAYFVFFFANKFSIPFSVSVALAIVGATLIGLACEVLVYRQMRKKNVPPLAYLIASIGLYVLLQNYISLFFGDDTKIINTAEVTVGNQIFGAYITTIQIITVFVSIALFIAVNWFLHYTATGKSIRAVASNPELCNIYGISSSKIILIAFGIGSALAAIAGILTAMDTSMTPTFGFNLLLYGVVAMIIGGIGSTRGLIAGALLVATAQHLAAYYIDTKWMDAITYIILILFLIWKPLGFSGKRLKKVEV